LTLVNTGDLYGTTSSNGINGGGTIFKVINTRPGLLTLYQFCSLSGCSDGQVGNSLVQATNGNLYGTTYGGGAHGAGTIFEFSVADGSFKTLYSFCSQDNCGDGSGPGGYFFQASNGRLYGSTYWGGNGSYGANNGTIFDITPDGVFETLYSFCSRPNCSDGRHPNAGVIEGRDGNFYGTSWSGGVTLSAPGNEGEGTVFAITPTGELTTLYRFCRNKAPSNELCPDGALPFTTVLQATDGNLYGTTGVGGRHGGGTVFKLTTAGVLTTLHDFCAQAACWDGQEPYFGKLVQHTNGNIYGTTWKGAVGTCSGGCGTVFEVSEGLVAFVKLQPAFGNVSAKISILGSELTGATGVTFGGVAAAYQVVSPSLITATVPTGATSSEVVVNTPRGTLMSNVIFQVLQ
jgi:uncharacterized repeat protein (TIGR03803 family)